MNCYNYIMFLTKSYFLYVNPFTLKDYFDINTLPPFIYIHNTNKKITKKYDTQTNRKPPVTFIGNHIEKDDVSVPIHPVQILIEIEY